jgi:RimJ/RimL family protein N-acetyltransferase
MARRDVDDLVHITDTPGVLDTFDLFGPQFTADMAARVIEGGFGGVSLFLGIRLREKRTLIGCMPMAEPNADEIEIGYWLGVDFRGRGYAIEAVSALTGCLRNRFPEKSIVAECRPENIPSWRLLERAGFHATGTDGHRPGRQKFIWTVSG